MNKKINITIPIELLDDLDTYCRNNCDTRSGAIVSAVHQLLNAQKVIDTSYNISLALNKAVEKGYIDKELDDDLKAFNYLVENLSK